MVKGPNSAPYREALSGFAPFQDDHYLVALDQRSMLAAGGFDTAQV